MLDIADECPRTVAGQEVGITGCSQYQLDDDLDGIPNAIDLCQNTMAGKIVDLAGCQIISETTPEDGASSGGGVSMTSALYIFAILFLGAAVFVTFSNREPGKTDTSPAIAEVKKDYVNDEQLAHLHIETEQE